MLFKQNGFLGRDISADLSTAPQTYELCGMGDRGSQAKRHAETG